MRFYRIVRFGAETIRYAEIAAFKPHPVECITIPSLFPKALDPIILWKETNERANIKKMAIHNKNGSTWFEMTSLYPIDACMDILADNYKSN